MKSIHHIICFHVLVLLTLNISTNAQTSGEDIQNVATISEELTAPLRAASDREGNIYVTDAPGRSISMYDASGNFLETIDVLEQPVSVAVNSEGRLFIGDGASGYIYQYDQSSGVVEFYTGTKYPSAMEFGQDNILYVTDSKLQQVVALDLSGNVVQTMGSGILDFPTGIAVDNNNQKILVGEHGGAGTGFSPTVKVYMFDFQGSLIKSFGSHGSSDGKFYRIQGLTVGKCGSIYVVDPYQSRISVFDESGTFLTKFGGFGLNDGELNVPMDIVFDFRERLLITSMNNGALELFSITDTLPTSNITSGSAMICDGESTDIEISFTGTAPWTFTYTIDGLTQTEVTTSDNPYILSVSEAGHYEIIALSDANYPGTCFTGCADVRVSSIAPTAHMTGDMAICEGDTTEISVDLTGSPPWSFTYSVDGEDPAMITTTNNPYIFEVTKSGLYTGSALNGGGCPGSSFTGSADITVNPLPTATITDGNGQIFIDPGESADLAVELTGSQPWKFTYTVDALTPVTVSNINEGSYVMTVTKPGTYEITEVVDSRCTSTISLGYPELLLNFPESFPTTHMDGGDLSMCPGESVSISVLFTGNAPWTFTYAVDTVLTTTIYNTYSNPYIINAIYNGAYEVIALSDREYPGTEFAGNAVVSIIPLPDPDFTYTSNGLEVSFNNSSSDAESYYWDFGDGNSSEEPNPVHLYQSEGEYLVLLTGKNGLCGDITLSRTINVVAVSVEPAEFEGFLSVYPNPSSGMVTLVIDHDQNSELIMEILDVNGKIVYSDIFHSGSVAEDIDLASFSSGIYFVRIISKDFFGIKKLILSTR